MGGTATRATSEAGEAIIEGTVQGASRAAASAGSEIMEDIAEGATRAAASAMDPVWRTATRTMANVDGELVEVWLDAQNNVITNMPNLSDIALQNGAQAGATAGTGFVSNFAAALASLNPLVIAALAGVGVIVGKAIYDHVQNVQHQAATAATDKYTERKEQVAGYKERYETLYNDLNDSSKSEAERVQIREQILSLQQEITGAYGAEAAAVDLVNGELREQLDIMDGLVSKQIEKNEKDPNVKKGYADAKEAMTKRDKYDFGEILDGSSVSRELRNAMNEIEGVDLVDGMEGTGTKIIRFEGDATGAKKAADEVQAILDDLQQKYIDDDNATAVLKHVNESMIPESDRLNDLLDRHHDNYIAGLEQELTTQQRKSVDELGQAIKDVNTAASSGEGFEEAYSNYVDKLNNIKLDSSHMPIVDELKDGLDEAAVSGQNFLDIINDDSHIGNNNQFAKDADLIQGYAASLKELGLQGIDVKEVLNDPLKSTNEGKEQILGLAKAFGVLGDDMKVNEEFVDSFITALLNAGTIADSVADAIEEKADDSFESFRSSIINDIANIDTLNAAIAESFSGKGLSYSIDENGEVVGAVSEIKKAYSELMEDAEVDQSALFQSTALGLKTNQTALRALQSELEAKNKIELNNQLEEAQKNVSDLQSRFDKMDKNAFPERYDQIEGELNAAKANLESVRELQAAYEGATSAYQKWVNAQSMGEEGDVYNAIRETAFKRGDELLEQGLVGTNEFRAIAQMFSDEDLSTAGIEKIISEYQAGSAAVKSFFTEGYEGLAKFGEDAASKGIEGIKEVRDEAGNLGYAFENVDVQQIADAYGVSASVIESIFGRMADYGIEVQRYSSDAATDLEALNQKAKDAQEAIKGLDDTSVQLKSTGKTVKASDIIDFDINDLDTETELENKISDLKDLQIKIGADTEEGKQVGALLDQLKQKKDVLEQSTNIPVTYTDLENANTAMSQLQTRISEIQSYNATVDVGVDVQNDEQVQQLANEIAALPKEAQVKVGISEENAGNAQAIVQQIQDNPASIKVTPELVKNDLDQEGIIKYSAEITKPIPESELNKKGTITYNSKMGKALNPSQLNKSQTINQTTNVTKNETTNKTVNTTVTGNATQAASQIKNALAGIQNKVVVINATDNATVKIEKVKSEKIQDKKFDIIANDQASAVINKVAAMTIPSKSVTITSNASAVAVGISSLARQINSLQNKTITITRKTVNVGPYNGTANAFGTAHANGTVPSYFRQKRIGSVGNSMINHYNGNAHAKGSWGLKRDEPNAIINELGPEIVVRNGQWFIANNGFPTLTDSANGIPGGLKKDDIIFNHLQTEEILKRGYVSGSHATLAHSNGSAHANGTVVGGTAHAYDKVNTFLPATAPAKQATTTGSVTVNTGTTKISSGTTAVQSNKTENKTEKTETTTTKKKSTKGKAKLLPKDVSLEDIDLVEVKLNNIERELNKVKTAAESAFNTFANRAQKTAEEINKISSNITDNNKAATTYQSKALSYIKNGKYRLTGKEKKQAKKIGLGTGSVDSILSELNNGAFEIDTIKTTSKANDAYNKVKSDKSVSKKKKNKLKKAAKKETKKNRILESLKTKISNYQTWHDKSISASETAAELEQQRLEALKSAFDLVKTEYDEEIRKLEHRNDLINEWISTNENQGNYISKNIYSTLALNEAAKKTKLINERTELQKKLQAAVAGGIAVGSEEYNNMVSEIDDATKAIQESDTAIAEFNKKIRELDYERFTMLQDTVSKLSDELTLLTDVMSEMPMYGEKGSFTEYGIATLGTYAVQYELLRKQAEEYGKQITNVSGYIKDLYAGKVSDEDINLKGGLKENIERLEELQSAQRSVIKNAYDMRKSIKSLVEEGFKKEIDSIKDLISEYLKMLDTQKSEYDYSKKITEQQEKITSLRRQLASWGNDSSEEGSAKRQKTAKELRDAEEALAESQEERRIAQTKEMLTDLQDEYEKLFNSRVDDISVLVGDVLQSLGAYQGNVGTTLRNVMKSSGLTSSEGLDTLVSNLASEHMAPIEESLETGVTISGLLGADSGSIYGSIADLGYTNDSIRSKVDNIYAQLQSGIAARIANADEIAKGINAVINNGYGSAPNNPITGSTGASGGGSSGGGSGTSGGGTSVAKTAAQKADESENAKNKMRSKAMNYIMEHASKPTKSKSKYSDVNKKIWELTKGKVLSTKELKALAKIVNVTYDNATSKGKFYAKLKSLRVLKRGTRRVPDNDYYWTQEGRGQNELITRKSDGAIMTRLGKGDMVFNSDMTRNLWALAKNPPPYADIEAIKAPDISSNISIGDSNVDITFNLPNVANADEFMKTLQKSKKFEQIVQSMTIGRIQGKGTLNKYNTRI